MAPAFVDIPLSPACWVDEGTVRIAAQCRCWEPAAEYSAREPWPPTLVHLLVDSSHVEKAEGTYARQLDTAVTTFRVGSPLLDVQESQFTTGGLDGPREVRGGVVPDARSVSRVNPRDSAGSRSIRKLRNSLGREDSRVATTILNSCGRHCCRFRRRDS